MGVDGTIFDVPDSEANAAVFARPSAGPRGEGAFPQVRSLAWSSWGPMSKSPWWCGPRPWRASDGRRFVPPSDVGDAPALGPGVLQLRVVAADDRGTVKVSARVKSGLILRPISHLSDRSYLAKIYKNPYDREKDRDGIVVRVIRYTLDAP